MGAPPFESAAWAFDFGCVNEMTGNLLPPHNPKDTSETHTSTKALMQQKWTACTAEWQTFVLNTVSWSLVLCATYPPQ